MSAVALNGGFGQVVIEEGVVLEFGEFELVGVEVEGFLENAEGFLFVEKPDSEEVADVKNEAARFLKQRCLCFTDMPAKNDGLFLDRKVGAQFGNSSFGIARQ